MKLNFYLFRNNRQLVKKMQALYYEVMHRKGFDTNLPLKWTHVFVDKDQNKLKKLLKTLKESGYSMERLDKTGDEWTLKVSKIDIISIENDYQKQLRLIQLTNFLDIQEYKGREAENIPPNQ